MNFGPVDYSGFLEMTKTAGVLMITIAGFAAIGLGMLGLVMLGECTLKRAWRLKEDFNAFRKAR